MRLLLDTHALLWWLFDDPKLPDSARDRIRNGANNVFVSAASAWEIATKWRLGKLPEAGAVVVQMPALLRTSRFALLPISVEHAILAGSLTSAHRDPFDRMLAAQAQLEALPIVTIDPVFADLGVEVLW